MGTTKLDVALTARAHDELPMDVCRECDRPELCRAIKRGTAPCGKKAGAEKAVEVDPRLTLPIDSASRKAIPLAAVLDYFPAALAEVAKLCKAGNDKHNPGQPLHWARGKSSDHDDCVIKHFIDRGLADPEDNISHTVKLVWRALAMLQLECEQRGAPMSRGSR